MILFLATTSKADEALLELIRAQGHAVHAAAVPGELLPLLQGGGFELAILTTRAEAASIFAGPDRGLTLAEAVKRHILGEVQREKGNRTRAARKLGVDIKTLYNHLNRYKRSHPGQVEDEAGRLPPG